MKTMNLLIIWCLIFAIYIPKIYAADSLSYSGRLVNTNGSPVSGPVDLKIELAYSNAPTTILCTQDFTGIVLSNGIFHLKLDLDCGSPTTLTDILNAVPAGESAALRVTDVTHTKVYSFQALHSMPFANLAETAKQVVQMGATNGQVLKWNNATKKWEPGAPGNSGTVTSVSGTSPISVATGTTTPAISIAQANTTTNGYLSSTDWNTFNSKQGSITAGTTAEYYRGDKSWQTLDTSAVPENVANLYFTNARALGVPLTGFSATSGAIAATDSTLQAFGKAQGQIDSLVTAGSNYLIKNSTDSITGVVNVGTIGLLQLAYAPVGLNDATNKAYVDSGDSLKVNKSGDTVSGVLTLDSDLKIKGGANYVTLKGHAASTTYNLILPSSAGTSGYVLATDGSGNTSWINPSSVSAGTGTVTSASIVDGTIVDADISGTADIAQSKIQNLTSDLSSKVSSTLGNSKILVGDASNVAMAVSLSGDATLANTGALTLANSGVTASTYKSVTVDAKGRVTGGTNPTTLAGYGITDTLVTGVTVTSPLTDTGTAAVPVIGMPAATTSVDGYLSATDWNIFNNKQGAITAASNINTGSITTNLQGGVVLNPYGTSAGNTGEVRFNELVANGTNYVALKSPDALAANVIYTLPTADGSSGQVLTTDAAGALSWTTVATGGTTLVGDVGGTIGANTIGAGKVTLTHLSATGTKNSTTYLRGDNTWSVLQTDVQSLLLSAYTLGTNAVVTTSDSVVSAFGKLQKQITDLGTSTVGGDLTGSLPNPTIAKLQGTTVTTSSLANKNVLKYNGTNWVNSMVAVTDLSSTGTADATTYLAGDNTWKSFNSNVIAAPLTGLSATGITKANGTLTATDSITVALNKLLFTQGDYVSKSVDQTINGTLAINSLTGFITVPTPVSVNDAANKGYVDSFGQWGTSSGNVYRTSGNVGIGTTAPANALAVHSAEKQIRIQDTDDAAGVWSIGTVGADNKNLNFMDDNTNIRMTIHEAGNVGIGTSSPSYRLDVSNSSTGAGSVTSRFLQPSLPVASTTYLKFGVDSTTTYNGADLAFFYNASGSNQNRLDLGFQGIAPVVSVRADGNVGIGTTSPTTALTVHSPVLGGGIDLTAADGTADDNFGISWKIIGSGHELARVNAEYPSSGAGGTGVLKFKTRDAGTLADRMTITGAGNVGIGTTTPLAKASIAGASSAGDGSDQIGIMQITTGTGVNTDNKLIFGVHDGDYSWIQAIKPGTSSRSLALNPQGGNVGIGTTSPLSKLTVAGTRQSSITPSNAISQVGGDDVFLYTGARVADSYAIMMQAMRNSDSQVFPISLQPNGGMVGIGTTSPNAKLDVKGTLHLSGSTSGYVGFAPAAAAGSTTYTLPSADGTNGYVLTTDGAGTLSWTSASASAPVTSVNTLTGAVTLTTTNVSEGTSQYYTNARAIASTITAPTLTNSAIATSDTIQVALGKLQAQFNNVLSTVLTGLSTATNSAITATDTMLVAFGKLQAQITGQSTTLGTKADLTNTTQTITALAVTGLTTPVAGADAANKTYVDSVAGAWTISGSDVYRSSGNVGIGVTAPTEKLHITDGRIRVGAASDSGVLEGGSGFGAKLRLNYVDGVANTLLLGNGNSYLNANYGNVGIGTTSPVANSRLAIKDGHIQSQQTTAPTATVNANAGTGATCTLSNATDVAGTVTIVGGTASYSAGEACKINFNKTYSTAPVIMISPANDYASSTWAGKQVYTSASTSSFSINYGNALSGALTMVYSYVVIETQ